MPIVGAALPADRRVRGEVHYQIANSVAYYVKRPEIVDRSG